MRFDLDLIKGLCGELGLACERRAPDIVAIELEPGVRFLFENMGDDDCIAGFEDAPTHCHGDFLFSDRHGDNAELDYLAVVSGMADGRMMVCELWDGGELQDRTLVHRDYVDEFRFLEEGDEVRVRKLAVTAPEAGAGG